jgi:hypothetical protein
MSTDGNSTDRCNPQQNLSIYRVTSRILNESDRFDELNKNLKNEELVSIQNCVHQFMADKKY